MGYFVTGATGFIGRNLVELLLEREGTIYVLVREGSQGRLAELRNRWGVDESRVVGIVGDLSQHRLGVSDADLERLNGEVDHLFHLAAIYDMSADAESQRVANVEGTRHMVQLAEAVQAGRVHMVSSIAAAGLYRGTWREDMFDEAQNLDTNPYFRTKHESERVVREECKRPWRVYRPGIVVGNSETGEMDKIDGPYYFFKLIRRIRQVVPAWMPMPGVEGREINIVPVDFVVKAMDHIAHLDDLDGRAFSLTDPDPLSAGEVIDVFARAAHAPQSTVRAPASATEALQPFLTMGLSNVPFANGLTDRVLADFGIPRSVLLYLNYPTHFDSRRTQAALAGTGIKVPPLEAYAGKLWDYWARHLDPDLYRDRTLVGAARGRAGVIGGLAQILEAQIPDEVMRFGRRLQGNTSLEKEVSGKVVLVTGASSGIGKAAALKIADAGGIVLLVARTPEKLEETRDQITDGGRDRPHPPLRPLRRRRHRPDGRRGARTTRQRRRPDQQRRPLDQALDRAVLRPLPRLRADDAAQLLRPRAADPAAPADDAPAPLRPDHQRQLDRRADQHAAILRLRRVEVGPRRLLALHRLGDHRRQGQHHDDPHAAGADADDRADEDVRPLPDDHARRGGRHALRRDHLQAEADRDAGRHDRADPLRDQPEVDRLHPQQRLPHVPRLDGREGREAEVRPRPRGAPRPTSRPTTSSSPSRT